MKTLCLPVFLGALLAAGVVQRLAYAQDARVAPPREEPAEVKVRGRVAEGKRLQQSAEAVTVVNLERAKKQSADLGEIMARTPGVALRRAGGLGSDTRFSLNGLYDDQIRFFLDGVPLDVAGYPFGIANVPVNLIERVEIYRGVVPVRFGADALGGAVQLTTDRRYETGASASYQVGSFGTYRLTLAGKYRHEPTGFVAVANGFFDVAKNNYKVDVSIPNNDGTSYPATVSRFHDGYLAYGASLETGFVDRPWARRLLLRAYTTGYDKEIQNDLIMKTPYGEVTYGERVNGVTLRYEQPLRPNLELDVVGSYAHRTIDFEDKSKWQYDWFGRQIREHRPGGEGEIEPRPREQTFWQHSSFGRAMLAWTVAPRHVVRLAVTPSFATRTGDERLRDSALRDPLTARRELFTLVSGLEYELNALSKNRFQNIVFVKDYVYRADSEEALSNGTFRAVEKSSHGFGVGDSLRFRFTDWLYAKASYEYATRMPRPDEVFGNGARILPNLELEPEVSHNGNVGPRIELRRAAVGELTIDVNGFLRETDKLIAPFIDQRYITYQNLYKARAIGVEGSFFWTLPGRWLTFDGSATFQDARNASDQGAYANLEGDRVPNRPWMFASWGARLRFGQLFRANDQLEPFYVGRYVNEFYRNWESKGDRSYKQTVDAQLTHGVGVTYSLSTDFTRISTTFEVQNVTDAKVYDFFGVQRPGRAFFVKLTGEI